MIAIILIAWILLNVTAVVVMAGFGTALKRQPLDQSREPIPPVVLPRLLRLPGIARRKKSRAA